MDDFWTLQKFLQEAGAVFNLIHDVRIRIWAAQYCLWIRDREINNVTRPAPEHKLDGDAAKTAEDLRRQLDDMSARHFPKEATK